MTLNNSMSITPSPPGQAKGAKFEHGSVLGGKTRDARVSSQWKSTAKFLNGDFCDRGRTERRHVFATQILHIGKEANKWEERYFLGEDEEAEIEYAADESNASLD